MNSTRDFMKACRPVELDISVKNMTSHLELKDNYKILKNGKKSGPNENWAVELIELEETGVVLEVPRDSCCQGEKVSLLFKTQGLDENHSIKVVANVVKQSFDSDGKSRDCVQFKFTKFDKEKWGDFYNLFSNRQEQIEKIFYSMKE